MMAKKKKNRSKLLASASNSIKSLSPYRVVPPLDVPAPPGGRRLEDRLLGLPPGWNKAEKKKSKKKKKKKQKNY